MPRGRLAATIALSLCALRAAAQPPATQPATAPPPAAPVAPAAEDESAPPRRPAQWLHIDALRFQLRFDAEALHRRVVNERRPAGRLGRSPWRQSNSTWRFEESLAFESAGWAFGDRVMTYDVFARWGLSQEIFEEDGPGYDLDARPDGEALEYDLRFNFLPAGKISGTAFASQLDDRIPRPFLPSLDRRRERYGAGIFFNDPVLPMSLTWEHAFERLDSGFDLALDDEDRRDDALRYEATWQPSPRQHLRFEYEHDRRREKYSGTATRFDTTRDELTLDHVFRFGPGERHSLETFARFSDERGDLARDTAQVVPQLRLRWSDQWSTTLRGEYRRESFERLELDTWRGDFILAHQFDDWLTSTLDLWTQFDQAEHNPDLTEWGGTLSSSLSRPTPWGRLSAYGAYTHVAQHAGDGRRDGLVLSESVTFRDPLPAYLAQNNVVASSVVVTDATRSRVYLAGRDYLVVQAGGVTSLVRVRTGRIADRQTVLVTYRYRAFRAYDLVRDRIDYRLQHDFEFGLTPYYAGSLQDEELDASDRDRLLAFRERNVNRHRLGLTYRRPRWSIGAEYEYHDESIDPYEAVHLTGDAIVLQGARHTLNANGSFSRFWFDGARGGFWSGRGGLDERTTDMLDLGVSYRYLLGERFEATAAARYRWENDSLFGDTHGVDLSSGVEYRIGYFAVSFEIEYDLLNLPGSEDDTVAAWLRVRRDIPVIGAR